MKLSVVILNYNVRYFLELCLRSVEKAIIDIDAEIIVVDNASEDESCDMVKSLFPHVKLIQNKENVGFSKGNNIGVKNAKGKYLCILNPDTVVAEDTFIRLIEFYESKSKVGIVGCQLIDGTGTFLPESKRNVPTPFVALMKMLGLTRSYYATDLNENEVGAVPVFVGAFMFLETSIYRKIGGFDEDYFMYGEDIDLSYRIEKAGYKNYYFGQIMVMHFKGESTLKDKVYAERFFGAMQIFYKKHFRSNFIFDAFVWLGIKGSSMFARSKKEPKPLVETTFVLTDETNDALLRIFPNGIRTIENLDEELPNHSRLIYDYNYINFKHIIADIKRRSAQNKTIFRFLVSSSRYILGSDTSTGRGEVLKF